MDSKILFAIISIGLRKAEKPMMLDTVATREEFEEGDIADTGFVIISMNITDKLTKVMGDKNSSEVMRSRSLNVTPEPQIVYKFFFSSEH